MTLDERLHAAVLAAAPLDDEPEHLARAAAIAERLNGARGGEPIALSVVRCSRNAFALGERRVYAGSAFFAVPASDAAIAFVVAHEMAHHDLRHATLPEDDGADAQLLERLPPRPAAEELEADRAALELVERAGFAPSGAREALALVEQVERTLPVAEGLDMLLAAGGFARAEPSLAVRREHLFGRVLAIGAAPALVPARHASTRATVACAECKHRFAATASDRCPQCGATEIVSLVEGAERVLSGGNGAAAATAGTVVLLAFFLAIAAPGAAKVLIGAIAFVVAAALLSFERRAARLRPLAGPLLPPGPTVTVRGTVRAVAPTRSPLGTSCAAWRLRGEAPRTRVDDAGIGAFDVVREGEVIARVEAEDAFVDLGPDRERPRWCTVGEELQRFLAARGGGRRGDSVMLAETVLLDGDDVEVSGVAGDAPVATGYREARVVPLYRDWPLVRKL